MIMMSWPDFPSCEPEPTALLSARLREAGHRDPSRPALSPDEIEARAHEDVQDAELIRVAAYAGLRRRELVESDLQLGLGRAPGCSRSAGAVFDYYCNLSYGWDGSDYCSNLDGMGRQVDVDDLLDANGVAELLDLAHRNTVSVYQHRYEDMPRPVRDFGDRRTKLWLRSEIERWAANLAAGGRTRRKLRSGR